jgi:CRP-like cAMP-binding protein
MALQQIPQANEFKRKLRDVLGRETLNSRAINVARHADVYATGDQDDMIYFIESGQIKLLMLSSESKECLLAIHSDGIFSASCRYPESARARKPPRR